MITIHDSLIRIKVCDFEYYLKKLILDHPIVLELRSNILNHHKDL